MDIQIHTNFPPDQSNSSIEIVWIYWTRFFFLTFLQLYLERSTNTSDNFR